MISVVICTYKRPLLLKKCIDSVINQITDFKYEIIVCDNDIEESAREIVTLYSNLQYHIESLKGHSHVRNTAVSKAKGEFVLFIDDDEFAELNWISSMIECQIKFNADVIFGRVVYIVPEDYPNYVKKSIYFNRRELTTGNLAQLNDGYTGNTLIRRSLFSLRTPSFLNSFNNVGGEDTDFFNFLYEYGSKLIFCNEAIIYEIQDEERKKVSWFYKRGYHGGRGYVKRMIDQNQYYNVVIVKSILTDILLVIGLSIKCIFFPYKFLVILVYKTAWLIGKISFYLNTNK